MPHTVKEFENIRKYVAFYLFGDKPDKVLDCLNRFMLNLDAFKKALVEHQFPFLVISLLYFPVVFIIMILNCLREALLWWIVALLILCAFFMIVGALCSVCFIGYRGYEIYTSRWEWDGKPKKK